MAAKFCLCSKKSIACIALLMCICLLRESEGRPPWLAPGSGIYTPSVECHTDDELLDLCQRCAKLTKSPTALSGCCSTDMEARKWCTDYVYFGQGQYEYRS